MKVWPIIAILGAMFLMTNKKPASKVQANPMSPKYAPIRSLIDTIARKHGVPPRVAKAFAWLESRFNPAAKGDLDWFKWNEGKRYQDNVLKNPKLAQNPYRKIPNVWHSYGIFQLLAPYFVNGKENPSVLFDPIVNAERGIKKIAASLKMAKGDIAQARIIYAGATKLSAETKKQLADKINAALLLFPED